MIRMTTFAFKFYEISDQQLICEHIGASPSAPVIKEESLAVRHHSFSYPKFRKGKCTNLSFVVLWSVNSWETLQCFQTLSFLKSLSTYCYLGAVKS